MRFRGVVTFMIVMFSFAMAANKNGGTDTAILEGRINSVDLNDSMIVIETERGLDTVYFDSKTEFAFNKADVLRPDTRIAVKYIKRDTMKVAISIKPDTADDRGVMDTGDGGTYPDTSGEDSIPQDTLGDSVPDTSEGRMQ